MTSSQNIFFFNFESNLDDLFCFCVKYPVLCNRFCAELMSCSPASGKNSSPAYCPADMCQTQKLTRIVSYQCKLGLSQPSAACSQKKSHQSHALSLFNDGANRKTLCEAADGSTFRRQRLHDLLATRRGFPLLNLKSR